MLVAQWRGLSLLPILWLWLGNAFTQCIEGDCQNGWGTYLYSNGAKYTGQFHNGHCHGRGVLWFSQGGKYEGQWINHYREGQGVLELANGDRYQGQFNKSKMQGKGIMQYANGERYSGDWSNDMPDGEGVYEFGNGSRYEGSFYQGRLHGNGTLFYKDGSTYRGNWEDNLRQGPGTFTDVSGTSITGIWKDGELESTGDALSLPDCNSGYCANGMGTYKFKSGAKWVGHFESGVPWGFGTCYYTNGNRYVGEWRHGAPDGRGTMYYADGYSVFADWADGRVVQRLLPESAPPRTGGLVQTKGVQLWALVVGVGAYTSVPALQFTRSDAEAIAVFLKSNRGGEIMDDHLFLLLDQQATRQNVLKRLQWIYQKADQDDIILLYFSGHGLPGSFLPYDFDGYKNALHYSEMQQIMKDSKTPHQLVILDACHAGSMLQRKSPSAQPINFYSAFAQTEGGTAFLLSSRSDEISLEDRSLRQGIFSYYVLKGLKGEADSDANDVVTIGELFGFVHEGVSKYTMGAQHPTLEGQFDVKMPVAVVPALNKSALKAKELKIR